MRHLFIHAALAVLLCVQPGVAAAGKDELPADIVTGLIPLATYGIAHYKDDGEGEGQFLRSTAASLVLNTSLRVALSDTSWGQRPNGNRYGFPSGHTAFMTSSAAFLQDRFGWKFGVPAYAMTAYVAWVRVDTDHHRWRDVVAGAAVSYCVSKLFVTPHDAVQIAPIVGPDWLGMRLQRSF